MRTALQASVALIAGVVLLGVFVSSEPRGSGGSWRFSLDPAFAVIVGVALLAFWMVMAWRAVRALESIAASLRRPAAPPPPPATE